VTGFSKNSRMPSSPRTRFLRAVGGDDDDGDVRELGVGLHPLPEPPPIHAGHAQVEQDSARTQPNTELAQSVRRTPSGFDLEAVESQQGGKSGAHVVIVIDDEHAVDTVDRESRARPGHGEKNEGAQVVRRQ